LIWSNKDMIDKFDEILDVCIDRINRGSGIEDCLADYPEYADELEPLLRSMLSTKDAYSFTPQTSIKQAARQRFSVALRESERKQQKTGLPFPWIFRKAKAWAVIATLAVVALAGYFGVTQLLPPSVTVYQPDSEGNFAFYISDAPISDFQSLDLTISEVRLQQADGDWVKFVPETEQVDLTQLQGELAEQVWRGELPEGQYTEVDLYISRARGILKSNSNTMDIYSSGIKLQLEMNFKVSAETKFVYDITVTTSSGGGYRLQQVAAESGTGKKIQRVNGQGQMQSQGQGNMQDLEQIPEQNQVEAQEQAQEQNKEQGQGEAQEQSQFQGPDSAYMQQTKEEIGTVQKNCKNR